MKLSALALAGCMWAAAGCDQNMSDTPLPRASAEDLSRLAARLSEAPSLSVPAGATISGVIEIHPALVGLTAPGDVLYVMAREPASEGPPVAVERLTGNSYPIRFVLDAATAVLPGAAQGRPLQLIVKVDKDGDAGTSSAEDLLGITTEPVRPGESDVRIIVEATVGDLAAALEREAATGRAGSGPREKAGPEPRGVRISGTIRLPEALHGRTSASDVVFVIARRPGAGGPPLAVARLEGNRYPMRFTLDDRDRMLGGRWPEAVELEVRIDKDGDPLTRTSGELAGRAERTVRPGDVNVSIELGA